MNTWRDLIELWDRGLMPAAELHAELLAALATCPLEAFEDAAPPPLIDELRRSIASLPRDAGDRQRTGAERFRRHFDSKPEA